MHPLRVKLRGAGNSTTVPQRLTRANFFKKFVRVKSDTPLYIFPSRRHMEQVQYDRQAERLSLQWAAETGPASYQDRLVGIQRDIASFQNEQLDPEAYWSGSYELGIDSHGNSALVTSEIAIPGRVHRSDSHAMVDSMAGNAVYVAGQIEQGNMLHEAWDTAREQLKQFRAIQDEVLKLQDGESFLGFTMNGVTTRDGVALMHVTRHANIFSYETRLVGGLSEGAAYDLLEKFTSNNAMHISLKENTDNPLYTAIKGQIQIDLKNQQQIFKIVQDVLDERNELKTDVMNIGSCRTKVVRETEESVNFKKINPLIVQQRQQYALWLMQKKRIIEVSDVYTSDKMSSQQHIVNAPVRSGILFDSTIKSKQKVKKIEEVSKKIYETKFLKDNKVIRDIIYPEFSQVIVSEVIIQNKPQQKIEVVQREKVFENTQSEHAVKHAQVEMPMATFVMKSDHRPLPQYIEKALVITIPAVKQLHVEQKVQADDIVGEYQTTSVYKFKKVEQHNVKQLEIPEEIDIQQINKSVAETDALVEVDEIHIQDMHVLVDKLTKQIHQKEVKGNVKKLVWMESNDLKELLPVEELEITQDSAKTMHNLLHFLRKIIRVYAGDDVIRERVISRIASDKQSNELEELEEYLAFLQSRQFRGSLFALVN